MDGADGLGRRRLHQAQAARLPLFPFPPPHPRATFLVQRIVVLVRLRRCPRPFPSLKPRSPLAADQPPAKLRGAQREPILVARQLQLHLARAAVKPTPRCQPQRPQRAKRRAAAAAAAAAVAATGGSVGSIGGIRPCQLGGRRREQIMLLLPPPLPLLLQLRWSAVVVVLVVELLLLLLLLPQLLQLLLLAPPHGAVRSPLGATRRGELEHIQHDLQR